jgi:hypothetical protein
LRKGNIDLLGGGWPHRADDVRTIMRRSDRDLRRASVERERSAGGPRGAFERAQLRQRFAHQRIRRSIPALLMRAPKMSAAAGSPDCGADERGQFRHRIAHQIGGRNTGIAHAVDEAGVGAVLQQAAHQIGEQFLVPADRSIDPHRGGIVALDPAQRGVNLLAHAVEALEFKGAGFLLAYRFAT